MYLLFLAEIENFFIELIITTIFSVFEFLLYFLNDFLRRNLKFKYRRYGTKRIFYFE